MVEERIADGLNNCLEEQDFTREVHALDDADTKERWRTECMEERKEQDGWSILFKVDMSVMIITREEML